MKLIYRINTFFVVLIQVVPVKDGNLFKLYAIYCTLTDMAAAEVTIYFSDDFIIVANLLGKLCSQHFPVSLIHIPQTKMTSGNYDKFLESISRKCENALENINNWNSFEDNFENLKNFKNLILGVDLSSLTKVDRALIFGSFDYENNNFVTNTFFARHNYYATTYVGLTALIDGRLFSTNLKLSYKSNLNKMENLLDLNLYVLRSISLISELQISPSEIKLIHKYAYINRLRIFTKFLSKKILVKFSYKFKTASVWQLAHRTSHTEDGKEGFANNLNILDNSNEHLFADPFVYEYGNLTAVFVEAIDKLTGKGSIFASLIDEKNKFYFQNCISEIYHMSFPFVFEFSQQIYMCPETSEANELRLYECTNFPFTWQYCKTIINNIIAKDPVIFQIEEKWYLLFSASPLGSKYSSNELHLYVSDHPLNDDWRPVSKVPFSSDTQTSRNAGLIMNAGRVFSLRQQHTITDYGTAVVCFEIEKKNGFLREEFICLLSLESVDKNIQFHHISSVNNHLFIDFKNNSKINDAHLILKSKPANDDRLMEMILYQGNL